MSADHRESGGPTYFGREHEAVRHVVAPERDAPSQESASDDDADDEHAATETVVTTLGIVLTIPKES